MAGGQLLAKAFVALESRFGKSSPQYDPWKCSFQFPLLLLGQRERLPLRYLVRVGDLRGFIDLSFYRLTNDVAEKPWRFRPPVDEELSSQDMRVLYERLLGFLIGYSEYASHVAPTFYRTVGASHVIYGKRRGELFQRCFDDQKEFDVALAQVQEELEPEVRRREKAEVEQLLRNVDQQP